MPGSQTTPDQTGARGSAPVRVAFHACNSVGVRDFDLSRLNGWPMRTPANASPSPSRDPAHDSGADVVRYSFIAMDLHHLLLAGFSGALHVSSSDPL